MRRAYILASATALLCGCQQGTSDYSGPRHLAEPDQISFARLDGWTLRHERDTWVQTRRDGESSTSVAVRAVPRDGWIEEGTPRSEESVIPATEEVLRALPGAELRGRTELSHPAFKATAFDLTFIPRPRPGDRVERRHVVLIGASKVFHVLHTGPVGDLARTRRDFERVLRSIREEG
jgi:hypothetical protein